jgi:hypothetical protein
MIQKMYPYQVFIAPFLPYAFKVADSAYFFVALDWHRQDRTYMPADLIGKPGSMFVSAPSSPLPFYYPAPNFSTLSTMPFYMPNQFYCSTTNGPGSNLDRGMFRNTKSEFIRKGPGKGALSKVVPDSEVVTSNAFTGSLEASKDFPITKSGKGLTFVQVHH